MEQMNARVVLETGAKKSIYDFDWVAVTTIDDEIVVKLVDSGGRRMHLTFARADLRRLFALKDTFL
jgi:hypothetical protein